MPSPVRKVAWFQWHQDTRIFPAYWILIGQFKFPARQPYARQRIERLWRDLYEGVIYIYYHLFHHLDEVLVIDPSNEMHMFALHYVYVPRINRHLETWKSGYIHHSISTAESQTPI